MYNCVSAANIIYLTFVITFSIFAGQRDIYGRRFLVLLPPSDKINKCEVHVTGTGEDLNVATGSSDGIIPGTKTGNSIKYNCENIKGMQPYTTLTNFSTKHLTMCKVCTDVGGIK